MQRAAAGGFKTSEIRDARVQFREAVHGLNDYSVQAVRAKSTTTELTESLAKQNLGLKDAIRLRAQYGNVLREQYQIQRMMAVQWSRNGAGQVSADVIIPQGTDARLNRMTESLKGNYQELIRSKRGTEEFNQALDVMKARVGIAATAMRAGSEAMINWGKNTQWAGRQLMVGFTMPLTAFGALAGTLAYEVDSQLARITKVYDTTAKDAAGSAKELERLRTESMQMGTEVARKYGVALNETLKVEAELAATGMQGQELIRGTSEVMRAATLGEMDYQDTVQASIALQSVYRMNTEELADAFNYLNALENATNLSMKDMVAAIPRSSGPLQALGVSIQETGILMAAMKSRGVEAAQGANALKSGVNRVLNPTQKVRESLRGVGIEIDKLVEDSGGNFMDILLELSKRMEHLDNVSRQRLIGQLFGTYQFSRVNAILQGLEDIGDTTTQVGRAFDVANQSTKQWGDTATSEMQQLQESASGKFKRALETLKAQIISVGEPFLEIGTTILSALGKVMAAFESLPSSAKKAIAVTAIIFAIAGPIVMLTGLFANLFGHFIKFMSMIPMLFSKFKPMTVEQRAQAMLAEKGTLAWTNQARAAQALSGQLQVLTRQMGRVALAQAQLANPAMGLTGIGATNASTSVIGGIGPSAPGQTNPYYRTQQGRWRNRDTGRFVPAHEANAFVAAQAAAARSSQQIERSSDGTARNWGRVATYAGGLGIAVSALTLASGSSSSLANNMMMALFAASVLGPTLAKAFQNSALTSAIANLTGAFSVGRRAGNIAGRGGIGSIAAGLSNALVPARNLLAVFMRFAGPVGLIASGVLLLVKMHGEMKKNLEEQKKINASAKDWSDILGYVYSEAGQVTNEQGDTVETLDAMASKLREVNGALVDQLQSAKANGKEQEAINMAISEGLKIRRSGGNPDQANEGVRIALRAAGYRDQEIENLMIKVRAQIEFEDAESVMSNSLDDFKRTFERIANNKFEQTSLEGFTRIFSGRGEINQRAAEAAKGMADQFWNVFQAENTQQGRRVFFDDFSKIVTEQQGEVWKRLGNANRDALQQAGISTWEQFAQAFNDAQNNYDSFDFADRWANGDMEKAAELYSALTNLGSETTRMVAKQIDAEQALARNIAEKNGATDKEIANIKTLNDLRGKLDMATMSLAEAEDGYSRAMVGSSSRLTGMSQKEAEAYSLKTLNLFRLQAGLSEATNLSQGFTEKVKQETDALEDNAQALEENAISADDYNNARKEAMSNAQNMALSAADDIWQKQAEAEVKAIEDRGRKREDALDRQSEAQDRRFDRRTEAAEKRFDNRSKRLDTRWDKIMENHSIKSDKRREKEEKAYDRRIQNIKDQIKAEEDAEAKRQAIFNAERLRLERLASIANQRIDFNVALNTGNLDEAAKIFNNIQAEQDSWGLDDAADSSKAASDARKAKMEARISNIEDERKKRLKSLKDVEDAEKKALNAKKQREQEALRAERDRYKKAMDAERTRYRNGIDAQKKAIQSKTANDVAANRAERERQRRNLELELLAIRASTPRNKKEYDAQINQIEGVYKKYGVRLRGYGKDWSGYIGRYLTSNVKASANKLNSEIKWKTIGQKVTDKMIQGGFDMNSSQFMRWVTTGNLPKNYTKGMGRAERAALAYGGSTVRHKGGPVGGASSHYNNRGGRSMSAGIKNDEVTALLKNHEYVLNANAHKALGTDALDYINETGQMPAIGGMGLAAGPMAAAIAGAVRSASQMTVDSAGNAAMGNFMSGVGIPGQTGKYAGVNLGADQLKNAAAIIATGKSMGANQTDLIVAIMTAMQESTLRNINYGDRDSLGLFQQRPSMGWGSPKQVTDPVYASRKFFEGLLAMKNRAKLPLWEQAQRVQRSAFPTAYAKWEQMARAVVAGTGFTPFQGIGMGTGRKQRPVTGPISRDYNRHSNLPRGTDFGIPTGSPVRAAMNGVVTTSKDLIGQGNGGYRSYGRYMVISGGNERTLYAHLSQRGMREGTQVRAGQVIGRSGNTGNSTGPHLHFETWRNNKTVHPRTFGIPGMETGGHTLSDGYAMLHKSETVLTAPLSEKLKSGINKIDQGVNNNYNVSVNINGPVNSDVDVERAVTKALKKMENKVGRSRKI